MCADLVVIFGGVLGQLKPLDAVSVAATGLCVRVGVFGFPLDRENDVVGYQLQEVEGLLHFIEYCGLA